MVVFVLTHTCVCVSVPGWRIVHVCARVLAVCVTCRCAYVFCVVLPSLKFSRSQICFSKEVTVLMSCCLESQNSAVYR